MTAKDLAATPEFPHAWPIEPSVLSLRNKLRAENPFAAQVSPAILAALRYLGSVTPDASGKILSVPGRIRVVAEERPEVSTWVKWLNADMLMSSRVFIAKHIAQDVERILLNYDVSKILEELDEFFYGPEED